MTSQPPLSALARALLSLRGLSVGDAVGECFFKERVFHSPPPWRWTDDTAMASSIVECLAALGDIEPEHLASRFLRRYARDPGRGYGAGAHRILSAMGEGVPWREASQAAFGGQGSSGNGAAMRAAPIGAYFADDIERTVRAAAASALPTHAHPQGSAGAIAIAVLASAVFAGTRDPAALVELVLAHTPTGEVSDGIAWVAEHLHVDKFEVAATVGNGSRVLAADTVPFAVWCAVTHLTNFEAAITACGEVGGDTDTTGAMVGGIVIGALGEAAIPSLWLENIEPLP